MTPHLYRTPNGSLRVFLGEDEEGVQIEREATVDEEHAVWASQRNSFDDLAQRADDFASERTSA